MIKLILALLLTTNTFAASTQIVGPALIQSVATITSAAGTTTLTKASDTNQYVTGSTTQTFVLPNATTLLAGRAFYIHNGSTDTVTVNYNGATLATTISGGVQKKFTLVNNGTAAGTWTITTVSSGSGSGEKNSITNGAFNDSSTGVAAYADAAGSVPVNGTGGSPGLTCTRATTSPLEGAGNLLITAGATDQGEGCSIDFSIDSGEQGHMQAIRFLYSPASGTYAPGTSSTDSDLKVFIYDVTNSILIYPSANKLDGSVNDTKYKSAIMEWQAPTNSTSYRLIFHVATAANAAFTMKLDEIKVGPINRAQGPPVSDLIAYTPAFTASAGTPAIGDGTLTGYYRRVGDHLEGTIKIVGGASTTWGTAGATLRFGLPSGLTIDETKLQPSSNGNLTIVGQAEFLNSGVAGFYGGTVYQTGASNYLTLQYYDDDASGLAVVDLLHNNNLLTFGASDSIYFTFKVPITGWSSGQTLSSSDGGRDVVVLVSGDAASAADGAPIIWPTEAKDTHAAYDTTTGRFTAPDTSCYDLKASIVSANAAIPLYAYVDASVNRLMGYTDSSGEGSVETTVCVNSGQILDIRPVGGALDISAAASTASFQKSGKGGQILAGDQVYGNYTSNTATSIPTATLTTIPFEDLVNDSHASCNTSTGICTVSSPGNYHLCVGVQLATGAVTWDAGELAEIRLYNGATHLRTPAAFMHTNTNTRSVNLNTCTDYRFVSGDTFKWQVYQTSTETASLVTSGNYNYMTFHRIGL